MKIVFFIENMRSGGKERRLLELIMYLKRNTNYMLSLVLMDDWIDYPYLQEVGIPIFTLKRSKLKKDPLVFYKFHKIISAIKPDIIHTWGPTVTFYAVPTRLTSKIPLIANIISNAKKSFTSISFKRFVYDIGFHFADKVLANSNAGLREYGMDGKPKSEVIYNGVRLERFIPKSSMEEMKSSFDLSGKKIILMVASTAKNKDYDLLLEVAMLAQQEENEEVFFLGVGRGPELERLKQDVVKLSLKNMKFLGGRTDVEDIISMSDICVLFTNNHIHGEGISNSIIEYMATSKPVISTDLVGGTSEIIDNGLNGFVMNPDAKSIYNKMKEILQSPSQSHALGQQARKKIENNFTIEVMGKKFTELYASAFKSVN